LTIDFNVYDSSDVLVPDSDISILHVAAGVYRGTCPLLTSLVNKATYNIELIVKNGPTVIWYFKGPAKAIIRSTLE
jgi:nicotinamide riboside kinase